MTSPLSTNLIEPRSLGSLLSHRAPRRQANHLNVCRSTLLPAQRSLNSGIDGNVEEYVKFDTLGRQLLELIPQGVLVVSRTLSLLYWNQKAKEICSAGTESLVCTDHLPSSVLEMCHRMMREDLPLQTSLVQEYLMPDGQTIRVTARWLENPSHQKTRLIDTVKLTDRDRLNQVTPPITPLRSLIAVFLENCDEVLREDLRVERKKYDLTERESEVWLLLRKERSYQEIAEGLRISLNTVKTHVKNIYAKRRSCQDQEIFWCCE
jgi:DNA-binding CsgD family transcriptional regulator